MIKLYSWKQKHIRLPSADAVIQKGLLGTFYSFQMDIVQVGWAGQPVMRGRHAAEFEQGLNPELLFGLTVFRGQVYIVCCCFDVGFL